MSDEILTFIGEVKQISEKAVYLDVDGDLVWVPDSVADYLDDPIIGNEIRFDIAEWLAIKIGLI